MSNKPRTPVVRQTVYEEVERLATYVGRMERRYECSSAFAEAAVASGTMKATAEVERWLTSYHVLTKLNAEAARGDATGTPTPATG